MKEGDAICGSTNVFYKGMQAADFPVYASEIPTLKCDGKTVQMQTKGSSEIYSHPVGTIGRNKVWYGISMSYHKTCFDTILFSGTLRKDEVVADAMVPSWMIPSTNKSMVIACHTGQQEIKFRRIKSWDMTATYHISSRPELVEP
jgi:hypothetical protein